MKKILFVCLLLLVPVFVWAGPFVVCDPYPAGMVDTFEVTYNGVMERIPYVEVNGVVVLKDLAGIADGTHTVTAKACNIWEDCSDASVPLEFVKELPAIPENVKLRK